MRYIYITYLFKLNSLPKSLFWSNRSSAPFANDTTGLFLAYIARLHSIFSYLNIDCDFSRSQFNIPFFFSIINGIVFRVSKKK